MKFQDSSFNGLKVTVGTRSVTHTPTHPLTDAPKAICPINFFKVGGITMMGWSPKCYIPSFVEINLPVPEKKIFEGFLPYMGVAAILVM